MYMIQSSNTTLTEKMNAPGVDQVDAIRLSGLKLTLSP